MRRSDVPDPDDDLTIPDGFAASAGEQDGFVDLPFEGADADPQPLEYDDLDGVRYDPEQNWRDAQRDAGVRMFGEFAPESEEATDG